MLTPAAEMCRVEGVMVNSEMNFSRPGDHGAAWWMGALVQWNSVVCTEPA